MVKGGALSPFTTCLLPLAPLFVLNFAKMFLKQSSAYFGRDDNLQYKIATFWDKIWDNKFGTTICRNICGCPNHFWDNSVIIATWAKAVAGGKQSGMLGGGVPLILLQQLTMPHLLLLELALPPLQLLLLQCKHCFIVQKGPLNIYLSLFH